MVTKNKIHLIISAISVAILVGLDQLTKQLAVLYLKDKPAIPIIPEIFELRYLENNSAAFGMDPISLLQDIFHFNIFIQNPALFLNVRMGFFILLTLIFVIAFVFLYIKIPAENKFKFIDYILIFLVAGALGNFIDRVAQQYVVDFLYFKLIDFPIFNVADIYVTCSTIILLFLGLFYYKDEDFDRIFPGKKKDMK